MSVPRFHFQEIKTLYELCNTAPATFIENTRKVQDSVINSGIKTRSSLKTALNEHKASTSETSPIAEAALLKLHSIPNKLELNRKISNFLDTLINIGRSAEVAPNKESRENNRVNNNKWLQIERQISGDLSKKESPKETKSEDHPLRDLLIKDPHHFTNTAEEIITSLLQSTDTKDALRTALEEARQKNQETSTRTALIEVSLLKLESISDSNPRPRNQLIGFLNNLARVGRNESQYQETIKQIPTGETTPKARHRAALNQTTTLLKDAKRNEPKTLAIIEAVPPALAQDLDDDNETSIEGIYPRGHSFISEPDIENHHLHSTSDDTMPYNSDSIRDPALTPRLSKRFPEYTELRF